MTMSVSDLASRWIVAQEGSRQSYGVPLSFEKIGALRLLYTDVWCRWNRDWLRKGPTKLRALATRHHPEIPSERVVSFNAGALMRFLGSRYRRGHLSVEALTDYYLERGSWFAEEVRGRLARLPLVPGRDHFFGFNTNCLETLEFLKERGVFTIVDQVDPGLVEEDMVQAETERWPGWAKVPGRMPSSYWERLRAEWETADAVLVNSDWSRDALTRQGVPAARIIVVPLAINLKEAGPARPINPTGPLKVVWLGSVILRKGIQYLIEAARLLSGEDIEFSLAGPLGISGDVVRSFPNNVKVMGRVTRDQIASVYRQGHVFVLPTLSDGFAITQLEAMSHGLPVVTTPNCGRVVTDGLDGLIVPAGDGAALAGAFSRLNRDRDLLFEMSRNALETVKRFDLPGDALLIQKEVRRLKEKSSVNPPANPSVRPGWREPSELVQNRV